jgi:DNA polymerase-3 subunit delta'
MTWQGIRGHDDIVARFRTALSLGRLASTFLFVGPEGVGKRKFALALAQSFLCDRRDEAELNPCGECPACKQVLSGSHPDVDYVAKPEDKNTIPIELLIGDEDHRMRDGLCYRVSLKPFSGKRKIAILDDADYLNDSMKASANALLKTLEEPPPRSVLILLGVSEQRQLPTIRSRCQLVRFQPLANEDVRDILLEQGWSNDPAAAARAAELAEGSVSAAIRLLDGELAEFRAELLYALSQKLQPSSLVKQLQAFADAAGKESAAKKARLRDAFNMSHAFFRRLMLAGSGAAPPFSAMEAWPYGADAAMRAIELCLEASAAVEANASPANVLEWWADELATLQRTGQAMLLSLND